MSSLLPAGSSRHVMDTTNPNDTLYVEYGTGVNDFALTASGAATPTNSFQAHPNQNPSNDGIATSTSGSAEILQDYLDTSSNNDCRIVEEPGNATGNTLKTNQLDCEGLGVAAPLFGRAIAANYNNELDFLFASSTGVQELGRLTFPTASAQQSLAVFSAGSNHINAIGAAQGHIFATSATGNGTIITGGNPSTTTCSASATGSAQVDNYAQGATTIKKSFTISNRSAAGAIAVSQDDSEMYVATCIAGSANLAIDQIPAAAGTPGTLASVAPTSSIGPFNAQYITALTVDGQGDLYVGLQDSNGDGGTTVRVYAPSSFVAGATLTKPTPLRVLNNPVPNGAKIVGLAANQNYPGGATPSPSPSPTTSPTVAPTATPTVAPTATPTVAPTATPTVTPTATPTATPTPVPNAIHDGGFESDTVAPNGSAFSTTGWTQCNTPALTTPTGLTPLNVGPSPASTLHPLSTITPVPGETPDAFIGTNGMSLPQPTSANTPLPTQTTFISNSGTYGGLFGTFPASPTSISAEGFHYDGLCQTVTVPAGSSTMAFSVFGNGVNTQSNISFDAILLNADNSWNSWLYDESKNSDTVYRPVSFTMPASTAGNQYTLFVGIWSKSSGSLYTSGYYFLDDISLYPTASGVASARRKTNAVPIRRH